MKIVSHYLESITGVEIYPIISFLIFFVFFITVSYMVFKIDKKKIKELASMPLDAKNENNQDAMLNDKEL